MNEMKYALESLDNRAEQMEERLSYLKNTLVEIFQF